MRSLGGLNYANMVSTGNCTGIQGSTTDAILIGSQPRQKNRIIITLNEDFFMIPVRDCILPGLDNGKRVSGLAISLL